MAIYPDQKLIFIHIPKSGGTSVQKVLDAADKNKSVCFLGQPTAQLPTSFFVHPDGTLRGTPPLNHMPAHRIKMSMTESEFDSYYSFSVVRNPHSRVLSIYKYWQSRHVLPRSTSFSEFINLIHKRPDFKTKWPDQLFFVSDEQKKVILKDVFRLEDPDKIGVALSERLSKPVQLTKERVTKKLDLRAMYNRQTAEHIAELYRTDFETFDYPKKIKTSFYFSLPVLKHRLKTGFHFFNYYFR